MIGILNLVVFGFSQKCKDAIYVISSEFYSNFQQLLAGVGEGI